MKENYLKKKFIKIIKKEIKARGWSQKYARLELEVGQSTISSIQREERQLVSISMLTSIIQKLGYNVEINLVKL